MNLKGTAKSDLKFCKNKKDSGEKKKIVSNCKRDFHKFAILKNGNLNVDLA